MKRAAIALLIAAVAFSTTPEPSTAQVIAAGKVPGPAVLSAEFHSGEVVRYSFTEKMLLATRVDPGVPSDRVASFTPRQYEVDGEIVAAFESAAPGEPLRGTVQFQGLKVRNWASSTNVTDLETCLRQLESTSTTLTIAGDGNLRLGEMPARLANNLYVLDLEDLYSLAQAVFISRITSEPLAPGQDRESRDFPVPGLVKPGLNMTVRTEYLANVPIAGQPSAEVRLSMHVPNQSRLVSSQPDVSSTFERLYAVGDWTYLLDLGAHQISFLRKAVRTETGYSVESADSSEAVRIPRNLFTVEKRYEVTARRMVEGGPPQRAADLDVFEKSIAPAHGAVANGSGAPASFGGEASLGDLARRLRVEQTAQTPPSAGASGPAAQPGQASASDAPPAGFKVALFPSGLATVYIPEHASEVDRRSYFIGFRLYLGDPTPIVAMSVLEIDLDPRESADHALQGVVPALEQAQGIKVLLSQRKTINGLPGMLIDALAQPEMPIRNLESLVIVGGKGLIASCGTLRADYPKIESLCRTMVESTKARQNP